MGVDFRLALGSTQPYQQDSGPGPAPPTMRIEIRSVSWTLSPELRTRARDRIRLAMNRHAPELARVRAVFEGPVSEGGGAGPGIRLTAVLRDGRSFEANEALSSGRAMRLEELVDRVAMRVAGGVQRSLSTALGGQGANGR